VYFYESINTLAGGIVIRFQNPQIQYWVLYCKHEYIPFPITPAEDQDKVWTIIRTGTGFKIECNGVQVLDYNLSSCTHEDKDFWNKEVKMIRFDKTDTASDEYNAKAKGTDTEESKEKPSDLDWTAVTRDVKIDFDLQQNPLQIKTSAAAGSDKEVFVYFYESINTLAGGIVIRFQNPQIQYWVLYCKHEYIPFPITPAEDQDKVWTIIRTGTGFKIECNGVQVLDYNLSSCTHEDKDFWNNEVKMIRFDKTDTASDEYKA